MRELHLKIYGSVQGVNFRHDTLHMARQLDLRGFIKNLTDGTVEITAQGEEVKLQSLLDWLRSSGPRFAKIAKISTNWQKPLTTLAKFQIEH